MRYQDREQDEYEMLLRKLGHNPSQGYVEGGYLGAVRCTRCGYQRQVTIDEDEILPCVVLDGERWLGEVA